MRMRQRHQVAGAVALQRPDGFPTHRFPPLALVAFAANSLLCRAALKSASIDPATFTTIRLVSGALVLWLLFRARPGIAQGAGNWPSAAALFAYAAGFSFAYITLSTATGACL